MTIDFAERCRSLRKEKGISQEKLAEYLNVSFQAVSKWETGNAYPDITLLPDIARFFGVTVDELLQAEKPDEKKRYREYAHRAEECFRNGRYDRVLEIWLAASKEMPNSVDVKEKLMSACYDLDKTRYKDRIIELGGEICAGDASMYHKSQAIRLIAQTYAEAGEMELAEKWILKATPVFNAQEVLFAQVLRGEEMLQYIGFCTYWFADLLFHMACRIACDDTLQKDDAFRQQACRTAAKVYEALYPRDDMGFESLGKLSMLHEMVAEKELSLAGNERTVREHLQRAAACAEKAAHVTEHELNEPLLCGWKIQAAPASGHHAMHALWDRLGAACYDAYRETPWFAAIVNMLEKE